MSINKEYLKGYLDGLCDGNLDDVYYDDEEGCWVCSNYERRIRITDTNSLIVTTDDNTVVYDMNNVEDVYFDSDHNISFKISVVI